MKQQSRDVTVVIVAGGSGKRMEQSIPKQYLPIAGKPIIIHTIEALRDFLPNSKQVLVVPTSDLTYTRTLLKDQHLLSKIVVVAGGSTRAESVIRGIARVQTTKVLIHDGVRPFVSQELLQNLLEALNHHQAVIPAIQPTDSIRLRDNMGVANIIDRDTIYCVQTPQAFYTDTLREAYQLYTIKPQERLTDDASIVEYFKGIAPYIIQGERANFKITLPIDLALAETILLQRQIQNENLAETR